MRVDWEEYATDDFLRLDGMLNAFYKSTFGDIALSYEKNASFETATDFFIAYEGGTPVAIACFRPFEERGTAELKRVFVQEPFRRKGVGHALLLKVEEGMKRKGFYKAKLVTGSGEKNTATKNFYLKNGYAVVEKFAPFIGDEGVICMEKEL